MTVINLVFSLVQYVLIERWPLLDSDAIPTETFVESAESAQDPPEPVDRRPSVEQLSRPPEGLSGTIQYLRMEDHYLRVVTDQGAGMTLHRMSDAIRDLEDTDGMQVHKSWWVSAAAIDRIRQINRRRIILTSDGTEVPVSRSFEPRLKDAGWF